MSNVLADRHTGTFLKNPAQMILTKRELARENVEGKATGKVAVNIGENRDYLCVIPTVANNRTG